MWPASAAATASLQADSDADGAGDGGGVWIAPSAATLNIRNTLLAGNADLSAGPDSVGG